MWQYICAYCCYQFIYLFIYVFLLLGGILSVLSIFCTLIEVNEKTLEQGHQEQRKSSHVEYSNGKSLCQVFG